MKKRLLAVLAVIAMAMSLTGCLEDAAKSAQKKITGIGGNTNIGDSVQQGVNEAFDQFKQEMDKFANQ